MPLCGRIYDYEVIRSQGPTQVRIFVSVPAVEIGFGSIVESGLSELGIPYVLHPVRVLTATGSHSARRDLSEDSVTNYLELLRTSVTIEDDADESHALSVHMFQDLGRHTSIGRLVNEAKAYDFSTGDKAAATRLASEFAGWIRKHPSYLSADVIAPVPAGNLQKAFDLPEAIANVLASNFGKSLVRVRSANSTPQKNLVDGAVDTVTGKFAVDSDLRNLSVLAIDDLYDTGRTMAEMVRSLKAAGAARVLALTAVKTSKNCFGMAPSSRNWQR